MDGVKLHEELTGWKKTGTDIVHVFSMSSVQGIRQDAIFSPIH